jgi:hypothetical protein
MPYYIVESYDEDLATGGGTLRGVPTEGYSPELWLYVVNTEENPSDWPGHPSGYADPPRRRAPAGEAWWVVVASGAQAHAGELRSTGNPLDAPPQGFAVFDWP